MTSHAKSLLLGWSILTGLCVFLGLPQVIREVRLGESPWETIGAICLIPGVALVLIAIDWLDL